MAATIKTLDDLDPAGKRMLVRVDFNVPLKDGVVTDDTRIRKALPTIRELLDRHAKVILMSHLGRPAGTGYEEKFSMAPVAKALSDLLGIPVSFATDTVGDDAKAKAAGLKPGEVLLLENLRFDPREKKNDAEFAKELASLAEVYVNDAFGSAHRAHASTVGVTEYLPAYAGHLLNKEVDTLTKMLESPKRPFLAILGGAKVSDKIKVIESLLDKADGLIIGGAMAFTFLAAKDKSVGTSLVEPDWIDRAREMMVKAFELGKEFLLPVDVVVAPEMAEGAPTTVVSVDEMPDDQMGLDIGPQTEKLYAESIANAKTIFWNGPMGVFEMPGFESGTRAVAEAVAESKADSVIGGGDSVAAVNKFGVADKVTFISTGGGASMELVQGEALPGVEALS